MEMQEEKEKSPPMEASGQSSDQFYEKLTKLYELSGLCLLFDFRKTILDLHLFYNEVTARGGFHQVSKDGKWDDLVSALNLNSSIPELPLQLQKLYANVLYKFEHMYFYRTSAAASDDTVDVGESSTRKWKHSDSSQLSVDNSTIEDGPMGKRKCSNNSGQLTGCRNADLRLAPPISSKTRETKKDPNAPIGLRTAYQIFLRKECLRLKMLQGENLRTIHGANVRDQAIDAWRYLSGNDRQPYIEESRKDKERYKQEMAIYKLSRQSGEDAKANANKNDMPPNTDGDYHVTLPPYTSPSLADESMAEITTGMMKNALPNDPLFHINWDDYCGSLDIPT
ncbi:high mobility group B protein 10-like [Malania oleifera]|uniref:high mobility group B protein 10-like n=1 Tax=Malania oleifera TaxID=397392 RepID=UPI0025AEA54B|nr:high mobility group B protein 10-like [Malania oleifera]